MRIFHVSDCYYPRFGGIEALVRDLTRAQAAAGHEVHILTVEPPRKDSGGVEDEVDQGVTIHRFPLGIRTGLPVNPFALVSVQKMLGEFRPDVVHSQAGTVSPFSLGVAKLAVGRGIPTAVTWQSMLDRSYRALNPFMIGAGWRNAPVAWSAVSRVAALPIEKMVRNEVAVVANCIELEKWTPAVEPPAPPLPLRGVAAMRLVPRKRTVALVDIVASALEDLPPDAIHFDIFGSGPDQSRIERRIEARNVGHAFTLHGKASREELMAHYRAAHVFCTPAKREAFGIASLEARTSGLVVLARRGTGVDDFITHGVDGLLAEDDQEMSKYLVNLATRPEFLDQIQSYARSHVPPYGFEELLERVFGEYRRAEALVAGALVSA